LLGYPSFAAMSMETKMAGSVGNVTKMIELLLEKGKFKTYRVYMDRVKVMK
jgi:Zn-dependent oligopeptidase